MCLYDTSPTMQAQEQQRQELREKLYEEYSCGLDLSDGWGLLEPCKEYETLEQGNLEYERKEHDDQEC